jgi:hypothetical protein
MGILKFWNYEALRVTINTRQGKLQFSFSRRRLMDCDLLGSDKGREKYF